MEERVYNLFMSVCLHLIKFICSAMLRFWINADGNPILQVTGYLNFFLAFLKKMQVFKN